MWTEELCASLRGLWREGLPTREIGKRLGFGRLADSGKNRVIGKAKRLGLGIHKDANRSRITRAVEDRAPRPRGPRKPRGTYKTRTNKTSWRQVGKPKPPAKIVVEIVDTFIPLDQRKTLLQLGENDCRFPVGDPTKGFWCNEEFFFCGGPTDGSPYCAGHAARVYNSGVANSAKRERPVRWGPSNQAEVQERPLQGVGG